MILKSKSPYLGDVKIKNENHSCQLFENQNHLNNEVILNHFQNYSRNHLQCSRFSVMELSEKKNHVYSCTNIHNLI